MRNKNVLISGASIAGPTLAYWLRRYGFRPTVVERAAAPRPGGQAVDIRGAAIDVVGRMGLLDPIRGADTDMRGMSYVDARGKKIASMDAAFGIIDARDVEIERGNLTSILYAATRNDVEYLFDDSITGLTERPDGILVTFERSAPRLFDLVVGADGLHSNVRSLAFGAESNFSHHLGLYLAIFSTANDFGLDHWQQVHTTPGRVAIASSSRDAAQAKAAFYFSSDPIAYDYRDIPAQQRILANAFADASWRVPQLLAAMPAAPDFYFDAVSQIRMDRWHRGRVVLVGDAGYSGSPLSGQGTSMALVGAYVLAGELAAAAGDHHRAFDRYETKLRDFVQRNQELAIENAGRFAPATKGAIRLQNISMRLLPYVPWKGLIMKMMTKGIAEAANAVTISDYAPAAELSTSGRR